MSNPKAKFIPDRKIYPPGYNVKKRKAPVKQNNYRNIYEKRIIEKTNSLIGYKTGRGPDKIKDPFRIDKKFWDSLSREQKQMLKIIIGLEEQSSQNKYKNDLLRQKYKNLRIAENICNQEHLKSFLLQTAKNAKSNSDVDIYLKYTPEKNCLNRDGISAVVAALTLSKEIKH